MFKMSSQSKGFLQKYLPEALQQTEINDLLMMLDAFITLKGLDENDNMTDFGHEAQSVYDDIYMCN